MRTIEKFRHFDRSKPLVSLHVPKCAGTGLWKSLHVACSPTFRMLSYYPDINHFLPEDWDGAATILHGHFVMDKGRSVEMVCNGANQFITVLRDPFQVVVSAYFYGKKEGMSWATSNSLEWFMEWWLQQQHGPLMNALPTIEGHRSVEEYAASFVQIGVVSKMTQFYAGLENILGVKFPAETIVNASFYDEKIPDLAAEFRNKFPLDYELFELAERGATH